MNRKTAKLIIISVTVIDAIFIGAIIHHTIFAPPVIAEEEHLCLMFADGKHALVQVGEFAQSAAWGGVVNYCKGHDETLKWLLSVGYDVKLMSQVEIYLERTSIPQNQTQLDKGQEGPHG
jgi:hypothetical protein